MMFYSHKNITVITYFFAKNLFKYKFICVKFFIPVHELRLQKYLILYIVTCQLIIGLRNKALLGSRQLNASRPSTRYAVGEVVFAPCRAKQNRTERCYTAGRDDVTRQHARFQGNAGKHSDLTEHSSHLARTIEGL
jgi:hypothetical protein